MALITSDSTRDSAGGRTGLAVLTVLAASCAMSIASGAMSSECSGCVWRGRAAGVLAWTGLREVACTVDYRTWPGG